MNELKAFQYLKKPMKPQPLSVTLQFHRQPAISLSPHIYIYIYPWIYNHNGGYSHDSFLKFSCSLQVGLAIGSQVAASMSFSMLFLSLPTSTWSPSYNLKGTWHWAWPSNLSGLPSHFGSRCHTLTTQMSGKGQESQQFLPDSTSNAGERCLLCEDRPRTVRIQCGHCFACEACLRSLTICSVCRAPITAGYNISGATSLSDSSRDDYVSSGSNTFVNMEPCHTHECECEATERFRCSACTETGYSFALCTACSEWEGSTASALCPCCGSRAFPYTAEHGHDSSPATSSGASEHSIACDDVFKDSSYMLKKSSTGMTKLDLGGSSIEFRIATSFFSENRILEVTEEVAGLNIDTTKVALEVCRQRMAHESVLVNISLYLAPTVPLVVQIHEIARQFACFTPRLVIGNADVDSWGKAQWCDLVSQHNLIITTPQLLLDTLDAKYLELSLFATVVVSECQHCSGRHPFARIFSDHYSRVPSGQIRVLGLSRCLVKPKVKPGAERQRVIRQLERLMDSCVMDASNLCADIMDITKKHYNLHGHFIPKLNTGLWAAPPN